MQNLHIGCNFGHVNAIIYVCIDVFPESNKKLHLVSKKIGRPLKIKD